MGGSGPTQRRVRDESLSDIIRTKAREAESAAYQAIKEAIRKGENLQLKTPSEVIAHGAKLLQAQQVKAARMATNAIRESKQQASAALKRVSQEPDAKRKAIGAARLAGNVAGAVRGGVHAVEGIVDGAVFVARLVNPIDRYLSPPGEAAADELAAAGLGVADYVRKGVADPMSVVNDVKAKAHQMRIDLDPGATPVAPTFKEELRRNFDIGKNQGELAFDVGSMVVGGPAAKAVKGLGRVSNVGNVERYLAQGFTPTAAAHLAEPYPASGMGSHFIPRRARLPDSFGGRPLPRSYMDGPFNKLSPPKLSRGDFYELHYKVDPHFHGTAARRERWSGRDLGLEKHGLVGQLWHGSPPPLKARVGGLGAVAGEGSHLEEGDHEW